MDGNKNKKYNRIELEEGVKIKRKIKTTAKQKIRKGHQNDHQWSHAIEVERMREQRLKKKHEQTTNNNIMTS